MLGFFIAKGSHTHPHPTRAHGCVPTIIETQADMTHAAGDSVATPSLACVPCYHATNRGYSRTRLIDAELGPSGALARHSDGDDLAVLNEHDGRHEVDAVANELHGEFLLLGHRLHGKERKRM